MELTTRNLNLQGSYSFPTGKRGRNNELTKAGRVFAHTCPVRHGNKALKDQRQRGKSIA